MNRKDLKDLLNYQKIRVIECLTSNDIENAMNYLKQVDYTLEIIEKNKKEDK